MIKGIFTKKIKLLSEIAPKKSPFPHREYSSQTEGQIFVTFVNIEIYYRVALLKKTMKTLLTFSVLISITQMSRPYQLFNKSQNL